MKKPTTRTRKSTDIVDPAINPLFLEASLVEVAVAEEVEADEGADVDTIAFVDSGAVLLGPKVELVAAEEGHMLALNCPDILSDKAGANKTCNVVFAMSPYSSVAVTVMFMSCCWLLGGAAPVIARFFESKDIQDGRFAEALASAFSLIGLPSKINCPSRLLISQL